MLPLAWHDVLELCCCWAPVRSVMLRPALTAARRCSRRPQSLRPLLSAAPHRQQRLSTEASPSAVVPDSLAGR
jgi:hypothetical protein